jgi:hypothetical protein
LKSKANHYEFIGLLQIFKLIKMKKTLYYFAVTMLITSCNQIKNQEKTIESTIVQTTIDSSVIIKQNAINILKEVDEIVRKGVSKELSNKIVNKKIQPLMKEYDYLLSKLNVTDSTEVQKFRISQINKIIDLQMQQN